MSRFDDEDERYRNEFRARMHGTVIITTILSFFISFAIMMVGMSMNEKQSCTVQPCAISQDQDGQ